MRHKNLLVFVDPKTRQTNYWELLQAILRYGWTWYQEYQAQEALITPLNKHLDSRYTLLRNLRIPAFPHPLPPVLVGPSGVFLLYTTPRKGYFRAREDLWEEMHPRSRRFRRANPNYLRLALGMARALREHLQQALQQEIEVQPILVLTDPGAMVDTTRPVVRVVMADGIENLARQIQQMRSILSGEDIENILEHLLPRWGGRAEQRQRPAVSPPRPIRQAEQALVKQTSALGRYFNFTRTQWIVLGVMALLNILILLAFVLYLVLFPPY